MDELGTKISDFEKQDIKNEPLTFDQVDEMKKRSGSYEALFSRKAMKYRSMGLGEKNLTEKDYRNLIQEEYTFLRRPVFILNDEIFIGNAKKEIAALANSIEKKS